MKTRSIPQGAGYLILISTLMIAWSGRACADRAHIAEVLADYGEQMSSAPISNLIGRLGGKDLLAANAAEWALASRGSAALDGLVAALGHARNSQTRRNAAETLGLIGNPKAVPALASAFKKDQNSGVRIQTARSLAKIGGPTFDDMRPALLETLLDRLSHDPAPQVRRDAAIALGELGDSKAVDTLMRAFQTDTGAISAGGDVTGAAINALGKIGAPSVTPLLTSLKDPSPVIRAMSAFPLGEVVMKECRRALDAAGRKQEESGARGPLSFQGSSPSDSRIEPALVEALADSYPVVRRNAASALGSTCDPSIVPALQKALQTERDTEVRKELQQSIDHISFLTKTGQIR